jgi:hypothetical protein
MTPSQPDQPHRAADGEPATGFPEPPGPDPLDDAANRDPHHVLNNPVGEPDPTEWPDPYETRPDPRDPATEGLPLGDDVPHAPAGATSTSEPHPDDDIEAPDANPPQRDRLDD